MVILYIYFILLILLSLPVLKPVFFGKSPDSARERWPRVLILFPLAICLWLLMTRIILSCNDLWSAARLSWPYSLRYGYPLYDAACQGPARTNIYGPVAALFYLPATFIPDISLAVMTGTLLGAVIYFAPVAWIVTRAHRLPGRQLINGLSFMLFFFLSTFLSSALKYSAFAIHADAPMLGLMSLSCAFLLAFTENRNPVYLSCAALWAVLAAWTKLTAIPLFLALGLYVRLREGRGCLGRFLLHLLLWAVLVSVPLLMIANPRDMFFNIVTVPMRHPWIADPPLRALKISGLSLLRRSWMLAAVTAAGLFWGPVAPRQERDRGTALWKNIISRPETLLFGAGLFLVPSSVLGFVKVGGAVNTFSPTIYFWAAAAVCSLKRAFAVAVRGTSEHRRRSVDILLIVLISCGLIAAGHRSLNFSRIPHFNLDLTFNQLTRALKQIRGNSGSVYFPWHPLAHLLAEGRLYHFDYPLLDEEMAGCRLSADAFRKYVPPSVRVIVYPKKALTRKALEYLPAFNRRSGEKIFPSWEMYTRKTDGLSKGLRPHRRR